MSVEETEEETQEEEEKATRRQSRDWGGAAASQGAPGATGSCKALPRESAPGPLEGAQPWGHLDFGLAASRSVSR